MRLPRFGGVDGLVDGSPAWPSAGATESGDPALLGSWSATRWQYASKTRHEHVVDIVAGLGGSVTMSLSAGAYVLTWDVPGRGGGSVGGAVSVADGRLMLIEHGAGDAESIRYHQLASATLSLRGEVSAWDFDGNGEEPAEFVAVLVRL